MSTMLRTQDRPAPMLLDARLEDGNNLFSGVASFISEIGYCISLSAQAVSFSLQAARSETYSNATAERLDTWPIDLWVF